MPTASLSTIAPFGYDIDIHRFLEAFKACGCSSAQFTRNPENPPSIADALDAARGAGLRFDSIHGLFGPHLDPSSPDAAHRDHCLDLYKNEARLALELGGTMVVVHPSRSRLQHADPPPAPLPAEDAQRLQHQRWPHLHDFMKRLADTGHELGVTFLIENLMHDCPLGHDPVQLAEQIMEINSPRIRMCFDTGHAHATLSRHTAAKRRAVAVALRICAPAVSYLHIHDNDGVQDQHLMPGRGGDAPSSATPAVGEGIDWPAVAEALRFTELPATRMLEVFEDPELSGPAVRFAPSLKRWLAIGEPMQRHP